MAIEYDRRFDDKLLGFVEAAKSASILQPGTLDGIFDSADKLGIAAVMYSDKAYGASHTYALLRLSDLGAPVRRKIGRAEMHGTPFCVKVWDPIAGIVTKPGIEPLAVQYSNRPVFLGIEENYDTVFHGGVFSQGYCGIEEFQPPFNDLRRHGSKLLLTSRSRELLGITGGKDAVGKAEAVLRVLQDRYSCEPLALGPVQDLARKMYDCPYYNLWYSLHTNIRDGVLSAEGLGRFVVDELL